MAEPDIVRAALERCRFPPPGTTVACGVSGGPDSLALLVLAVAHGLEVTAVHVDHGIRPDSADDAGVVRAAAGRLGAGFRSEQVMVADGPGLEARARRARHAVLPPGCLLGHTMDDQAETVLLALLRGTGPDGLAAMDHTGHPLLGLRRVDTEAVVAAAGLIPVRDPSNRDPRFRRNRVRHELVPVLADIAERDVVPLLARLAGLAREDRDHLDAEAAGIDVTAAAELAAAPVVVARRAVRSWLRELSPDRHPPDLATVERVLAVADGSATRTDVGGGHAVHRTAGRLRVVTADDPTDPACPETGCSETGS